MAKKKDETTSTEVVVAGNCPDCGSELFDHGEFLYCGDCQKMISK